MSRPRPIELNLNENMPFDVKQILKSNKNLDLKDYKKHLLEFKLLNSNLFERD